MSPNPIHQLINNGLTQTYRAGFVQDSLTNLSVWEMILPPYN